MRRVESYAGPAEPARVAGRRRWRWRRPRRARWARRAVGPALVAAGGRRPKRGGTLIAAQEVDPRQPRSPHGLELFRAAGIRARLREPDRVRREDERRAGARAEVGGHERRQDVHVPPPAEREVPQRPAADGGRREVQHRARAGSEDRDRRWRSWLDAIKEIKVVDPLTVQMNLDAPFPDLLGVVRGAARVRHHAEGVRRAGERQDQGDRDRPVQAGRVRPAGAHHLRAERGLLGPAAAVPRRDDVQDPDRGDRAARRAARGPDRSTRPSARRASAQLQERAGDHGAQGPERVGGAALHQRQPEAARRRAGAPGAAHGGRHERGHPEGRVRRGRAVRPDPDTGYGDWALDPQTLPYLKPDLDGAKKLLAEAGYPNGGFTIEIKCSPQYPEFVASTLVVQDTLRKLNVTVPGACRWSGARFGGAPRRRCRRGGKDGGEIFASANTFRPGPGRLRLSRSSLPTGRTTTAATAIRALDGADDAGAVDLEPRPAAQPVRRDPADSARRTRRTGGGTRSSTSRRCSSKFQGYTQSFTGRRIFLKKTWLGA